MADNTSQAVTAVKKPGLEERLMSLLDNRKRRFPVYAILVVATLLVPLISDNFARSFTWRGRSSR
jgi:hypothetical protein